jgi:hypothetical protein
MDEKLRSSSFRMVVLSLADYLMSSSYVLYPSMGMGSLSCTTPRPTFPIMYCSTSPVSSYILVYSSSPCKYHRYCWMFARCHDRSVPVRVSCMPVHGAQHNFNANKDNTRSTTRDRPSPIHVVNHQVHGGMKARLLHLARPLGWSSCRMPVGGMVHAGRSVMLCGS